MLCGVMIAATFTFLFAIPANSDYWRMEIYKRGGAEWIVDKNGRVGWKWLVPPVSDTQQKKPALIIPSSQIKVRTEQL